MPSRDYLVLYHGHCLDGFTAAWAARCALGPTNEYRAVFHGQQGVPEGIDGRHVVIVDFCYDRARLEAIAAQAASVLVLDHHITAVPILDLGWDSRPENLSWTLDMARSGAGLTWDHYHDATARPWLVNYVEDWDLWRKVLRNTNEVHAFINAGLPTWERWDELAAMSASDAFAHGKTVWAYMQLEVGYALKRARRTSMGGYDNVFEVNSSVLASEIGNALMLGEGGDGVAPYGEPDFAAVWFVGLDGKRKYSLRSTDNHVDVSQVATQFGGGGHRNAAGFTSDGEP